MKRIAIIPARSGSKGLKNKNIKELNGKPLIAYSIECANNSGMFDKVFVSTDSQKYADIAIRYGADASFLRSEENSSDTAGSWDVVREVVERLKEQGEEYDEIMLLQATSPLRSSEDIVNAIELLHERNGNAIVSLTECDHSPIWCNTLPEDGCMDNFDKEEYKDLPRQMLPVFYRYNGALYLVTASELQNREHMLEHGCYPEEFNRQAVGIISQYNFAPTQMAAENLIREGKDPSKIYITGNTVIDAMQHTVREDYTHPELDWVGDGKLIFITAHRRENLGAPMHNMFRAIRRVLDEHPECKAVYPIHMNPVVRKAADEELGGCDRIHIIEPIEVFDCHNFEARCHLCLTDSGGIQEEVPSYGRPVLVMRDTTERPEGVKAGTLRLVGTDEEVIYKNFKELLESQNAYDAMAKACNPYGDGHACARIADVLETGKCNEWG